MEIITNIYGMILNLIKTLLDMFGADTTEVDKLLGALEDVTGKEEETTTVA